MNIVESNSSLIKHRYVDIHINKSKILLFGCYNQDQYPGVTLVTNIQDNTFSKHLFTTVLSY